MADRSFLDWPFFERAHRALAEEIERFADRELGDLIDEQDVDGSCRRLVRALGDAGLLGLTVIAPHGGRAARLDVRSLCLARELLAYCAGLADFAFAMQGLGSGPVSLFGTEAQKARYLPPVATGEVICGFALTEPEAGSDAASIRATVRREGDTFVLDGTKTWISNGGIADHYVVFARSGEAPGARGLSALIVDAATPGLEIAARLEAIARHPLATLRFEGVRVPAANLLGAGGDGFKIAMATLDVFRTTVGAAALGFARRALDEALDHAERRQIMDRPLAELQMSQARLADMAASIDAAALLVYRAAWAKDQGAARVTREAAIAKLFATEAAQQVIDGAVQLHGAEGVRRGARVEALYREIRALRIYEGASEVQKLVIARAAREVRAQERASALEVAR
jgi:acyl-CoA dehydrogenase